MTRLPAPGHRPSTLPFYAATFLPSATFLLVGTSSLAAGTFLACALALLSAPTTVLAFARRPGAAGLTLTVLALGVAFHSLGALSFGAFNLQRAVPSFVLLLLACTAAIVMSRSFFAAAPAVIDQACRRVAIFMVAMALLSLSGLLPLAGSAYDRLIFPFAEPSHFALGFTPILMYCCLRWQGWRRYALLLLGFALGYLLQNLTLVVGCLLIALVCVRGALLPIILVVLIGIASVIDVEYFTSRLDLNNDSQNISTLAYLQGWQLAEEGLTDSSGWGIGFQQLGEQTTSVEIASTLYEKDGLELNLSDGGFIIAKLVAEFGAFGIALAAAALVFLLRSGRRLRAATASAQKFIPNIVLARCFVVSFALDLVIRGTGYFSGFALLFLASTFFLASLRHANRPAARGSRAVRKVRGSLISSGLRRPA